MKPAWRGRPITSIGRRDVLELIDKIADRGAVTLARRLHAYLHQLFRWCVGRGIIETNPLADLPKPGAVVNRDRVLINSELRLVWNAADKIGWPFGPAIRLLILTGARRDEITGLRSSEIQDDRIELKGVRTKNGEPHAIPLSQPARALIAALPRAAKTDLVFTTTGRTPVSGWSRAKERLDGFEKGLDPWVVHDLRRTVATGMQRLGVALQTVKAVLGHISGSRAGVVGIYQRHNFNSEKREALDWSASVSALANFAAAGAQS